MYAVRHKWIAFDEPRCEDYLSVTLYKTQKEAKEGFINILLELMTEHKEWLVPYFTKNYCSLPKLSEETDNDYIARLVKTFADSDDVIALVFECIEEWDEIYVDVLKIDFGDEIRL